MSQSMGVALIILQVLSLVVGLGLVFVAFRILRDASTALKAMEKRIDALQKQVATQQDSLADLRKQLDVMRDDPVVDALNLVTTWRDRPWVATLGMIGAKVFRTYFNKRRNGQSALPAPKK
ncbi:MAG: hypothetical protein MUC92_01520 [Fimbriimonadaceae bacterium]|jgi:hypothetical protein|nr:hypothetical protein [Fimbriimonadaceae bacterium]